MCKIVAVLVLSISLVSPLSGEELDIWEIGDRETLRLSPTAFPDLPQDVADDLESRECLIPQMDYYEQPHNVIRGHFKNSTQVDWAVLCSISRKSTILVYWGGSTDLVVEVPSWGSPDDKFWLQGTGEESVGFSRGIHVADAKYIEEHARSYGGELPDFIDHEGIDEGFDGKASAVHYWFQGEWLSLQGAD